MKIISFYKTFFQEIKQKKFLPFYFVGGEDFFLIRKAFDTLKRLSGATEIHYLLSKEIDKGDFSRSITQEDMFAPADKKVYVILNFEKMSGIKKFINSIKELNISHILFLWIFDISEFRKKVRGIKDITVYQFNFIPREEAIKWLGREFKRRDKIVPRAYLEWMYERFGPSLYYLNNIMEILYMAYPNDLPPLRELKNNPLFSPGKHLAQILTHYKKDSSPEDILKEIFGLNYSEQDIQIFINQLTWKFYLDKKLSSNSNIVEIIHKFMQIQRETRSIRVSKLPYFEHKVAEFLIKGNR